MKEIKIIVDKINEEFDDAESYVCLAEKYMVDNEELSSLYIKLASQELGHADMLHSQAVKLIKAKSSSIEIPPYMKEMWEDIHKEFIDNYAALKVKIDKLSNL